METRLFDRETLYPRTQLHNLTFRANTSEIADSVGEENWAMYDKTNGRYVLSYAVEDMQNLRKVRLVLGTNKNNISEILNLPDEHNKTILDYAKNPLMKELITAAGGKSVSELSGVKHFESQKVLGKNQIQETQETNMTPENQPTTKDSCDIDIDNAFEEISESSENNTTTAKESIENSSVNTSGKDLVSTDTAYEPPKIPDTYKNHELYQVSKDDAGMSDIIGFDNIKQDLQENIITPVKSRTIWDRLKGAKVNLPNGLLFVHPKKSAALVKAFVKKLCIPALALYSISGFSSMVNDISDNYEKTGTPTIVVAEGLDKMLNSASPETQNKFEILLKNCSKKGVLFVGTTTEEKNICGSFMQSGIFDKVYNLKNPVPKERKQFLKNNYITKEIFKSLENNIDDIVNLTEGFSYADIHAVLSDAARECSSNNGNEVTMEQMKTALADFTAQHKLTPINDFNRTSAYDTADLKRTPITANDPTLNELGGMTETKKRLQTLYVNPMQNIDKLQEAIGNDAFPDGAIFWGEPGNGKTYIAKALAKTLKLPLYELKMSDFGTALVHESGKAFKQRIDQLKKKFQETGERSVLFLDELDSLAGNRTGSGNTDKELVDILLQELNNPQENGFIVIGATNNLESIDPAIKRRGRLGNHIEVKAPNFDERCDIIKKSLAKLELTKKFADDDTFIKKLSADFEANSISSITTVLKDAKREYIIADGQGDFSKIISAAIDANNQRLIAEFCDKAHLKRHEYQPWDFKNLDELAGMDSVKKALQENVIDVWTPEIRKQLTENKIPLPGGVILYGPPACGKTTIVETLARQMNVPLYKMDYSSMNDSQYIHQISKHVKEIFDRLAVEVKITKKPVMLFFDEAERFFPNNGDKSWTIEEVNTYKDLMNNASQKGIILIGATNYIDRVNPEITGNPRRMGTKIECGLPDEKTLFSLLQRKLLDMPIATGKLTEENCQELAKRFTAMKMNTGKVADFVTKYITHAVKQKEDVTYENIKRFLDTMEVA